MPDYASIRDMVSHRVTFEFDSGAKIVGDVAACAPVDGPVEYAVLSKAQYPHLKSRVLARFEELPVVPRTARRASPSPKVRSGTSRWRRKRWRATVVCTPWSTDACRGWVIAPRPSTRRDGWGWRGGCAIAGTARWKCWPRAVSPIKLLIEYLRRGPWGGAANVGPLLDDGRHPSAPGTATQILDEELEIGLTALGQHFHRAVPAIAHPPRQSQPSRLVDGRGAITHPLHASVDHGVQTTVAR